MTQYATPEKNDGAEKLRVYINKLDRFLEKTDPGDNARREILLMGRRRTEKQILLFLTGELTFSESEEEIRSLYGFLQHFLQLPESV